MVEEAGGTGLDPKEVLARDKDKIRKVYEAAKARAAKRERQGKEPGTSEIAKTAMGWEDKAVISEGAMEKQRQTARSKFLGLLKRFSNRRVR